MWELGHKKDWAPKNWCFQIVVLEKSLQSLLDCKEPVSPKGNQTWIFMEGQMLKLHYFDHLIRTTDLLEKTLMLGKIEGKRRRMQQRMRCLIASLTQRTWIWTNSGRQWRTGKLGTLQFMGSQRVGHDLVIEQQQPVIAKHILESTLKTWANNEQIFPFC